MEKEIKKISKLKKKDRKLERLEKRYIVLPVICALLGFTICSFNINLIVNIISILLMDASILVPAIFHYDIINRIKSKRNDIAKTIRDMCNVEDEKVENLSNSKNVFELENKSKQNLINKNVDGKSLYEKEKGLEQKLLNTNELDDLSEEEILNMLGK